MAEMVWGRVAQVKRTGKSACATKGAGRRPALQEGFNTRWRD